MSKEATEAAEAPERQALDALGVLQKFKTGPNRDITIKDKDGETHRFTLRSFGPYSEYREGGKHIEGRLKTLETLGHIEVFAPREMLAPFMDRFPDAEEVPGKPDTLKFFMDDETEIKLATTLETSVLSPPMPWNVACIYTRVNGALALEIGAKVNEINGDVNAELEAAKND